MIYPLVRDLAARTRARVPVAVTCRVLGFSKQAYYSWLRDPVSQRDWDDAHLIDQALAIHSRRPRVRLPVRRRRAARCWAPGRARTASPGCARCKESIGPARRRSGKGGRPGPPVHDDLVGGAFTRPGRTRSGSPTSPSTPPLRASSTCARSRTCYSNRIVGYSIDSRMKASLAVAALRNAVALRRIGPADHRALRPWQPVPDHGTFLRELKAHQLRGSMGRVGTCADNAAMESFFSLLQKNVLDRQPLDHPRGTPPRDRHLDRKDLPPSTPTTSDSAD